MTMTVVLVILGLSFIGAGAWLLYDVGRTLRKLDELPADRYFEDL